MSLRAGEPLPVGTADRPSLSRASKLVRLACVLVAAAGYAMVAWLFLRRLGYPYDLEWMEGGSLCHALRVVEHQPIYAPPSVDFIPFLYTPLYPILLAALAKVTGLGYVMARAVSIVAFASASAIAYRFAARASGSRAAAACAMALPVWAYAKTGSFYDIARADSLWLLFTTWGLVLVYRAARTDGGARRTDGRRHATAALAGLLLVCAFFTKQTAAPFMIAAGLAALALDFRIAPALGGAAALVGLPSLWLANRATGGWFWRYVFELHQHHDFYAARAFKETPIALLAIAGPALLVVPWAIARRRSPALLYASFLALVGLADSCVAFGTQWAYTNAYIPGVFFPSLAIAVAGGRLCTGDASAPLPRHRPAVVYALVCASLLLLRFDPRPFVPTRADRDAGDRLIQSLRDAPGDVLVPFHPFYAHLAGKRTYLHRMGVHDIWRAGLGPPAGLWQATREHRWALAVFDDKIDGTWMVWPAFQQEYVLARRDPGPRTVSGAPTRPLYYYVPRPPAPPPPPPTIDRELQ